MTVEELIKELQKVKNKGMEVKIHSPVSFPVQIDGVKIETDYKYNGAGFDKIKIIIIW